MNSKCVTANYGPGKDGEITVYNRAFRTDLNAIYDKSGTARCNGPMCLVDFGNFAKGDYRVLDTDYTSYSIVYSCT